MKKKIMIGSLAVSLILFSIFLITDEGAVLTYLLVGLLISFICTMLQLSNR